MEELRQVIHLVRMSDRDFGRLREFIQAELGIKMPPAKRTLLESRLQKRLKALGFKEFGGYVDFLFSPAGMENEIIHMIDLVTTNKTDFFREQPHFDYLLEEALPALVKDSGAGIREPLALWSAGCSTGEEPYTIAMVLNEFGARSPGLGFDYSILATDISTRVLEMAGRGIYKEDRIDPVPAGMRNKYLLRSRDKAKGLVRIIPELREHVRFRRLNFMDESFGFRERMDIIFCRNVVIYFDKDTQERLFRKFCECMRPGGYLFIGHSETLNGFDLPLEKSGAAVYRKY